MFARFAHDDERATWNELIAANPGGGEVWASEQYAAAKSFNRYTPRYVVCESDSDARLGVLILEKRVPILGRLWYVPAGPPGDDVAAVLEASAAVARLARAEGAFLLKVEPRIPESAQSLAAFARAGYRKTFRIIPNESTVVLDISGSEDDVAGRFAASCRNKIRRAEKEGLVIETVEPTEENCQIMFDLLAETSAGRFELRPFEYYRDFWQTFAAAGNGVLLLGYHNGVPVAGVFGMLLGETSVYKDGASVRQGLPTGAMNALQWQLILWARARGAVRHDLCGAPHSSRVDDKTHPLYGVGQYKLAFNKVILDYVGTFDLPLRASAYRVWAIIGDRLARRLALAKHHDPYY